MSKEKIVDHINAVRTFLDLLSMGDGDKIVCGKVTADISTLQDMKNELAAIVTELEID